MHGGSFVINGSIVIKNGAEIISNNNLYVIVCDNEGNPLNATIQINGGSGVDGFYSGFSEFPFSTETATGITIEASANGFTTNQEIVDLNEFGYVVVKLILEPVLSEFFCETFPINEILQPISRVVSNGKIRVVFSNESGIDTNLFSVFFEAFTQGSDKRSVIPLFGELIEDNGTNLIYDFEPVDSDVTVCYIPQIMIKQC